MSTEYVASPADVVQIGQKVKVRVIEIDDQHRINLSMLFGDDAAKAPPRPREGGGGGGGRRFDRGPRRRF
jgi:predicted RNA-binding protein with RPS1 domain